MAMSISIGLIALTSIGTQATASLDATHVSSATSASLARWLTVSPNSPG